MWSRLTPRDRLVLDLVAEHRVLTTWQLLALAFPSEARAQRRLRELTELGVLFRTQPHRAAGGSTPFHYLLGYRGAELLAARQDSAVPRPAVHAQRITRVLESPTLRHLLGANQFFADLTGFARGLRAGLVPLSDGEGLRAWHSEAWVREHHNVVVQPDGFGVWRQHGASLGFYLEHDTGSESLRIVADKLDRYTGARDTGRYGDALSTARLLRGMVLFWVASARRERNLRRALAAKSCPVPIATAARDYGDPDGPAGEVWLLLVGDEPGGRRRRIGDLAAAIGGTEPDGKPTALTRLPEPDVEHDDEDDLADYDDEDQDDSGNPPVVVRDDQATAADWLRGWRSQ